MTLLLKLEHWAATPLHDASPYNIQCPYKIEIYDFKSIK
jgi:hypothetical protein